MPAAADSPSNAPAAPSAPTTQSYDAWSNTYDATFGRLVHKRQTRAIHELRVQPGMNVLDLGVGTGLSMTKYPAGARVVGVDLSLGMLQQAQRNLQDAPPPDTQNNQAHLPGALVQADALRTPFADHAFDRVMVSHVISVVPDPAQLLRECQRVVKPDGRIVVLNHFQSPSRLIGFAERVLNPLFVKLGWRSDLTLHECLAGQGLHLLYHFKLSNVDFWQILVLSPTPIGILPDADQPHPSSA